MTVAGGFGLSRIGQIAITVDDLPGAVAFYRDVLGITFLFEAPPAMAFFDCGGVRLMMSQPEGTGEAAGQRFASIIYYTVSDIQEAADLWMGFFRDPDRNLLAIMSEVTRGPSE